MKNHLRTLSRLLPRGTLRFDPATLQANSSDAWVASALPTAVAFPRNTAEVSKILAFTYRHRWESGDLIMWDNRCTQHYAPLDYDFAGKERPENHRLMFRSTLA